LFHEEGRDNIIVAQEIIHFKKKKKEKKSLKGWMTIKSDLEKTYDHLS